MSVFSDEDLNKSFRGTISKWFPGRHFGFILADNGQEVFLGKHEWPETIDPKINTVVVFCLGKNSKGWAATSCTIEIVPQVEEKEKYASDGKANLKNKKSTDKNLNVKLQSLKKILKKEETVEGDKITSTSDDRYKFGRYAPKACGSSFFDAQTLATIFQAWDFYRAMESWTNAPENVYAGRDLSVIFVSQMEDYRKSLNDQIFSGLSVSENLAKKARDVWKVVSSSPRSFSVVSDMLCESISHNNRLSANAEERSEDRLFGVCFESCVQPHADMVWISKAAWILLHASRSQALCPDNFLNAFILVNWYLLRVVNVPFPLAFNFDLMSEETNDQLREALTGDDEVMLAIWISKELATQWVDFDHLVQQSITQNSFLNGNDSFLPMGGNAGRKMGAVAAVSEESKQTESESTATAAAAVAVTAREEEARTHEVITSHRRAQRADQCFICMDDNIRPTISLLCCGQPCHIKCMEKWYASKPNLLGREKCPQCTQEIPEPLLLTSAPPASSASSSSNPNNTNSNIPPNIPSAYLNAYLGQRNNGGEITDMTLQDIINMQNRPRTSRSSSSAMHQAGASSAGMVSGSSGSGSSSSRRAAAAMQFYHQQMQQQQHQQQQQQHQQHQHQQLHHQQQQQQQHGHHPYSHMSHYSVTAHNLDMHLPQVMSHSYVVHQTPPQAQTQPPQHAIPFLTPAVPVSASATAASAASATSAAAVSTSNAPLSFHTMSSHHPSQIPHHLFQQVQAHVYHPLPPPTHQVSPTSQRVIMVPAEHTNNNNNSSRHIIYPYHQQPQPQPQPQPQSHGAVPAPIAPATTHLAAVPSTTSGHRWPDNNNNNNNNNNSNNTISNPFRLSPTSSASSPPSASAAAIPPPPPPPPYAIPVNNRPSHQQSLWQDSNTNNSSSMVSALLQSDPFRRPANASTNRSHHNHNHHHTSNSYHYQNHFPANNDNHLYQYEYNAYDSDEVERLEREVDSFLDNANQNSGGSNNVPTAATSNNNTSSSSSGVIGTPPTARGGSRNSRLGNAGNAASGGATAGSGGNLGGVQTMTEFDELLGNISSSTTHNTNTASNNNSNNSNNSNDNDENNTTNNSNLAAVSTAASDLDAITAESDAPANTHSVTLIPLNERTEELFRPLLQPSPAIQPSLHSVPVSPLCQQCGLALRAVECTNFHCGRCCQRVGALNCLRHHRTIVTPNGLLMVNTTTNATANAATTTTAMADIGADATNSNMGGINLDISATDVLLLQTARDEQEDHENEEEEEEDIYDLRPDPELAAMFPTHNISSSSRTNHNVVNNNTSTTTAHDNTTTTTTNGNGYDVDGSDFRGSVENEQQQGLTAAAAAVVVELFSFPALLHSTDSPSLPDETTVSGVTNDTNANNDNTDTSSASNTSNTENTDNTSNASNDDSNIASE